MPHLTFFYFATPCFPVVRVRPCYGVKQVSLGLLCICISSRSSYCEVKQANQGWSSLRVCSAHHCGALRHRKDLVHFCMHDVRHSDATT